MTWNPETDTHPLACCHQHLVVFHTSDTTANGKWGKACIPNNIQYSTYSVLATADIIHSSIEKWRKDIRPFQIFEFWRLKKLIGF